MKEELGRMCRVAGLSPAAVLKAAPASIVMQRSNLSGHSGWVAKGCVSTDGQNTSEVDVHVIVAPAKDDPFKLEVRLFTIPASK